MDFPKRYAKLNHAQREAVDTIEGPVLVVAGPGTGKTELLSVRAANILQKTDTTPDSILCLTFTDNAANEMRQRLSQIIGKDAHKVSIHTFHSFGSEIINQNQEYFYNGAEFRPADELSRYEVMHEIFDDLELGNVWVTKKDDQYMHIKSALSTISDIKRSGLATEELLKVIANNQETLDKAEPWLQPVFEGRINKAVIDRAKKIAKNMASLGDKELLFSGIQPMGNILAGSFVAALDEAIESDSYTPLKVWRDTWLEKNRQNELVFKSQKRQKKLRAICAVYDSYINRMREAGLYDFDDMIYQTVHALEVIDELRLNLQEKYLYIMVDEFQDTNLAQMRILHSLSKNDAGDPTNIFAVGDDDQAIYSFQGADVNHILDFTVTCPEAKLIALKDNYRSANDILRGARGVILQGSDRLETRLDNLNKELTSQVEHLGNVDLRHGKNAYEERAWIAQDIKQRIKNGQKPSDIAVLTRKHSQIESLLPYLQQQGIAINYEKRDNLLEHPLIEFLHLVASALVNLASGDHDQANSYMPKILAHSVWALKPQDIWQISLNSYKNRALWLETMESLPKLESTYKWFIEKIPSVDTLPLEQALDSIVGQDEDSLIFKYFFSQDNLQNTPETYVENLEALREVRTKLREYRPNQKLGLREFVEFINMSKKLGLVINSSRSSSQDNEAINVMSAHKSKGLEFDTVYISNVVESNWGEKVSGGPQFISYPENLPLKRSDGSADERLRLLYVAMTRAKKDLILTYSDENDTGKKTLPAGVLEMADIKEQSIDLKDSTAQRLEIANASWYQQLVDTQEKSLKELLEPRLQDYKLSVTHLGNFLDTSRGGPIYFLMKNLLNFPEAKSGNASYGTAVHEALRQAHTHLAATGRKQAIEDVVGRFNVALTSERMNDKDFAKYSDKGSVSLRTFLEAKYDSFSKTQKAELDFKHQNSSLGEAILSGKLDLVDINQKDKTICVTDYKTGKPAHSWKGKSDPENMKLHRYKHQLMFYKLLVENSRDFAGYSVTKGVLQFVEPDENGEIVALETDFSTEDMQSFSQLVEAVWGYIKQLDLPDVSHYGDKLSSIKMFEKELLDSAHA
jgi:DNA helicase-2/ATP-dependent DNA helicase PcrA